MNDKKYSEFEKSIWDILRKIPKGKVVSYLEVARSIAKPSAVRAVANAIGRNPYAPKVPCHRVVKSDGSLGGYSGEGGLRTKIQLLKEEGVEVRNGKIVDFMNKKYCFN